MKKILAWFFILMITAGMMGNMVQFAVAASDGEDLEAEAKFVSENVVSEATVSVSENNLNEVSEASDTASANEVSGGQAAVDLGLSAPSYLLMEASTGTIILNGNSDEVLRPASITKVMTMLLIFDALKDGKIKLEEEVTVSEYASSMGGSQVFLEAGEKQTVETMLKCIAVASANDACAS